MYRINENYLKLPGSYLFSTIAKKVAAFADAHKGERVIRMGIGDVTKPLCPAVIQALHKAVDEMGEAESFRGYGPENGYAFLRDKMVACDYKARGAEIRSDEIFISDGAKSDSGNIQEIFSLDSTVAVCDPVYPVYLDTNVMAGRSGDYDAAKGVYAGITYLPCTAENEFTPEFPAEKAPDLIYLCSPNNPTGAVMRKEALQRWVDYANENGSVILFDAAYEAYITEPDVPHTIYECEGARTCAIELRSFSKKAGFTGLRLGATVVPHDLRKKVKRADGTSEEVELHALWSRRHGTKFNGAPYIVQRAGEAVYSEAGQRETADQVAYYMRNAHYMYENLKKAGFSVYGGVNAPYVWVKTPGDMTSWDFFDTLLEKAAVVGTPGSGFGPHGEHFFRFSAFGTYEDTVEAMARIRALQF
nr:LL-diaminopimelate aminotransferase [uncultured Stomatobaculum sp.]